MPSVFSKIVNREIPANIIFEDDHFMAFLDINPLVAGHTLVIPKEEVDYIFDLDPEVLSGLMVFAQKIARAIDQWTTAQRVGVAVIGLEVPHAHIHLVPINGIFDIDFSKPKLKFSSEEFKTIAAEISEKVNCG
jgi:histidine triad (HIT) family protein